MTDGLSIALTEIIIQHEAELEKLKNVRRILKSNSKPGRKPKGADEKD